MIRTSPAAYYRAAATIVAAAVLSITTRSASAQQTVDLFGGTIPGAVALTLNGNGVSLNQQLNGAFGPDFTGTVQFGVASVSVLSEQFVPVGGSNAFQISQTGLVGIGEATSATKVYTTSLTPGGTYSLTLTRATGFTVGLLSSVNLSLSAGGTQFLTTVSNPGLLGAADLLSLFGNNNVATFQFTVPANASGTLGMNITTTETASALGGTYTFSSAVINPVPEPGTVVAMLLGATGLMVLRFRRRLRAA